MIETRQWRQAALLLAVVLAFAAGWAIAEGELSITEHGVGTGVEDRALVGEASSFPEGATVVFWTRVVGGVEGDRIEHLWTGPDGKEVRIGLAIGGPHWRTYSTKVLHPGSAGAWSVRAVDAEGHTLAESTFECPAAE